MNTKEIDIYKSSNYTANSSENCMVISVVIRVRNAAKDLHHCLDLLRQQILPKGAKLEFVVVDNESTDHSSKVAEEYGAKIVSIPVNEFTWGRALNQGIAASKGEFVLLLSADAYPAEQHWIKEMVAPFKDPQVAVVYGRQIPRPDAPIDEIVRLKKKFGGNTFIYRQMPPGFTPRGEFFPASNACAAIRKEVWREKPYDEKIEGGEDGVWTYDIFEKGYFVSYQAEASVYHSHNDSILRNAWRHLELLKKNATINNKQLSFYDYARFVLSKTKRRVINSFSQKISIKNRSKGMVLLPLELISFCILALFFHRKEGANKYRNFFWGK